MIGLAIFVAPTILTQLLILFGAVALAAGLLFFHPDNPFSIGLNLFSALAILVSGGVAVVALGRGGIPPRPARDAQRLRRPVLGPVRATWLVYLGTAVAVVFLVFLVSGFAFVAPDGKPVTLIPASWVNDLSASHNPLVKVLAIFLRESSRPATLVLSLAGLIAFGYLVFEMVRLPRIPRQRMYVVLILIFFSVLFFAFFEQAGSSLTNFTDRNVDRVTGRSRITAEDIGRTIDIQPTQKQLGYHNGDKLFTLNILTDLRNEQRARAGGPCTWRDQASPTGPARFHDPLENCRRQRRHGDCSDQRRESPQARSSR